MSVTQANRAVAVSCSLPADTLLFERMHGTEHLGQLSEFRVQLLSTKPDVKIADVLGKPMGVHVDLTSGKRHFHGIVTRFACTGWIGAHARYEAVLHPGLWLLTRSSNCRIFQKQSVVQIVKAVCEDEVYGGAVDLDVSALSGSYPELEYCVQYRETDFQFVCRLLEEAGIYFFFRHEEAKHTMVLADSYGAHAAIPGYGQLEFSGEEARGILDQEAVHGWRAAGVIQSGSYVLNDFNYETANASASGGLRVVSKIEAPFGQKAYEMYDYPGGYLEADQGTPLARARLESLQGQAEEISADTNARGLYPGGLFALVNHPRTDQNREFLVTGAGYDVVGDVYASGGEEVPDFVCRFTAIGKEHAYRPPRTLPKPVVRGPQTAMVVGPSGEEIHTDPMGRIKVQFHWDRDGEHDAKNSCWVRVQQSWAGKNWGSMFIPRVGMEVVVSFLEGDPDRPLVTGCVYNSDAMPPFTLETNKTQSGLKTNTSPDGGGFNELRFEDKKDFQEIYIQAEKDFNRVVKNNDTLKVGFEKADKGDQTIEIKNDRSLDVGNDHKEHVANDHTVNIDHDQTITIKNDRSLDVSGNHKEHVAKDHTVTIDKNQTVSVTGDQKVTVSKTIAVEATTSIELKVGSSSIKIEPAKITIKSVQIAIEAEAVMEVKAGATMTVKSAAPMSVKSDAIVSIEGALVKIN